MNRLPWILLSVTVVVVAMVALSLGEEPLHDTVFYGSLALTLATMGAFVASQQPAPPIGWIFCGLGLWGAVAELWEFGDRRPGKHGASRQPPAGVGPAGSVPPNASVRSRPFARARSVLCERRWACSEPRRRPMRSAAHW